MTERLYYQNQYLSDFSACVISCAEGKNGFEIILDRSAFYPEGGGQPGDSGFIGGVEVVDTVEKNGEVVHICRAPLDEGERIDCSLNFEKRFSNMQQHTGEHIFSGIAHSVCGCENVGFHMGANGVTVDFNLPVSADELSRIERLANEAIYKNIAVEALYPTPDELEKTAYRSKKELEGQIRLVRIDKTDVCACCGTHVALTGEVGMIKAISMINYKSGVRITLKIGRSALEDYCEKNKSVDDISTLLCAKTHEVTAAVERLSEQLHEEHAELSALKKELFSAKAQGASGRSCCMFDGSGNAQDARIFCDLLADKVGIAAVFSGKDGEYKYAVVSRNEDVRPIGKALNEACKGRGGGKPDIVQGSVMASRLEIERFWNSVE